MSETAPVPNPVPAPVNNEGAAFSLLALLAALARKKRFILCSTVVAAVLAGLVNYLLPSVYVADVKILPPQQSQSGAAGLLAQLGGVAAMAGGAAGIKNPNDLYIGMLRSRTVTDQLIAQFKLVNATEGISLSKARRRLDKSTTISSGKDGLIVIEVTGKDKKLVAPMANAYVAELLKLTSTLALTEASQRRAFFQRELESAKDRLAAAEVALRGAMETHGVISVEGESKAIVETVARVRAQISAKEVQLSSMQAFVTPQSADYRQVQQELVGLRLELSKLENGRPAAADAAQKTPVGLANIKILRDIKYYQMLYELLAKQFEMARLDEAKDSPLIQLLDRAVEPEGPSGTSPWIILFVAGVFGFVLACAIAALSEVKKRMVRDPAMAAEWQSMTQAMRVRQAGQGSAQRR